MYPNHHTPPHAGGSLLCVPNDDPYICILFFIFNTAFTRFYEFYWTHSMPLGSFFLRMRCYTRIYIYVYVALSFLKFCIQHWLAAMSSIGHIASPSGVSFLRTRCFYSQKQKITIDKIKGSSISKHNRYTPPLLPLNSNIERTMPPPLPLAQSPV